MPVREEYEKRAYCKAITCPVQAKLDASSEGAPEYEQARETCKSACLRSAEHFLGWVAGAGFVFVDQLRAPADESRLDGVAATERTAWRFHRAAGQQGLVLVRKL